MTAEVGGSDQTCDFHLVESLDGWRLTIQVTDRLLALIGEARATNSAASPDAASFTIHVEPNLLPGGPFEVTAIPVAAPQDAHVTSK